MSNSIPKSIPKSLPSRVLGLDYGLARIGLALSDERKVIASSLKNLQTAKKLECTVDLIIQEIHSISEKMHCKIEKLIIGNPLRMSGKQSMLSDEVQLLKESLEKVLTVPIILWDERLSTVQATRCLKESTLTRKRRSKLVDGVTAAIILQSYLDHLSINA